MATSARSGQGVACSSLSLQVGAVPPHAGLASLGALYHDRLELEGSRGARVRAVTLQSVDSGLSVGVSRKSVMTDD